MVELIKQLERAIYRLYYFASKLKKVSKPVKN